jgi:hypothetical protein
MIGIYENEIDVFAVARELAKHARHGRAAVAYVIRDIRQGLANVRRKVESVDFLAVSGDSSEAPSSKCPQLERQPRSQCRQDAGKRRLFAVSHLGIRDEQIGGVSLGACGDSHHTDSLHARRRLETCVAPGVSMCGRAHAERELRC